MKIVFPIDKFDEKNPLESKIARHFGPANFYLITDENGNFIKKIQNVSTHHGGDKLPPDFLSDYDVNIIICNDLGIKAIKRFDNLNIEVFITHENTVLKSFKTWQEDKLAKANSKNGCHGHH